MAKGAIAKKEIMQKIIEMFPGSFLYNNDKEVRINSTEEGNPVQIKITLTCAKIPVENESENVSKIFKKMNSNAIEFKDTPKPQDIVEPTEEEKANLKVLLDNFSDNPPWDN